MIEAFKEEIYRTLKIKYDSLLKDNFNTFLISLSGDIKRLDNIHNKDFILKNLNRAIKTTKTRWVNKILKDYNIYRANIVKR